MSFFHLSSRLLSRHFTRSFSSNIQYEPKSGDRVVVGMSGGVDSSVAARLLADKDFDLSAVFMRNWDTRDESGTDIGCEWEKDWEDVQRICKSIGIPCQMIDLSREYWNRVFEPALRVWEFGQTPNPDVWCNREIKFGALLERLPIDPRSGRKSWFATGHYARKAWSSGLLARPKLLTAKDEFKDQSFYLSSISEEGLARALFPLGSLTKAEVRGLARRYNLETAERPESMGLCFVGERGRFNNFLSSYIPQDPGPIIDMTTGNKIAMHSGLWNFTIGQKAKIPGMLQKMFVARKDYDLNSVYVVPGGNHEALYIDVVYSRDWTWIWRNSPPQNAFTDSGLRALVKIRHRAQSAPCTLKQSPDNHVIITIDEPQKGVSPGQIAAIWKDDWCLGCGTIASTDQTSSLRNVGSKVVQQLQESQEQYLIRQRQSAQCRLDQIQQLE